MLMALTHMLMALTQMMGVQEARRAALEERHTQDVQRVEDELKKEILRLQVRPLVSQSMSRC